MEQLPNELLVHILGGLHPVFNRLARLSLVCKRWNNLIQHTASLWEHVHLKSKLLTDTERSIVFNCFNKFEPFIKCLRVASLEVVFGEEFWFFIHRATYELANITCFDIPTFPWNIEQLDALKCAEKLKELNLYGFWDLSDIQWTQTFNQPFSMINEGHLHLIKARCKELKVLKLSMNMLRVTENNLMDMLDVLNLKELHVSAYNCNRANIPMSRSSVRLLKFLLSSRHVSLIAKLELRLIPMGHKELRLLLRMLTSLKHLNMFFGDIHRCMAGYQFLESKSLECFELDGLPAINIVTLKCSMPRLRRLAISGCSNLLCLHVVSSVLQQLVLKSLTTLRSLHIISTTLKFIEVTDCSSLTSETIHKVLRCNARIERCTLRGDLFNFRFSQIDNTSHCLTELSLWIRNHCNIRRIQVHCQTLRSFTCNYQNINAEYPFTPHESWIDLRSKILVYTYISLPRVKSINIKCEELKRLLLNLGRQNLDMFCCELRVDAGKKLTTLCAEKCLFTHVRIHAEETRILDFNRCGVEGSLALEGNLINIIYVRSQMRPQANWDLIARCKRIRKIILRECEYLSTINVFPYNTSNCFAAIKFDDNEILNVIWPNSYNIHGSDEEREVLENKRLIHTPNYSLTDLQDEMKSLTICGEDSHSSTILNPNEIVEKVALMNCPCFKGVVVFQKKENSDASCIKGKASTSLELPDCGVLSNDVLNCVPFKDQVGTSIELGNSASYNEGSLESPRELKNCDDNDNNNDNDSNENTSAAVHDCVSSNESATETSTESQDCLSCNEATTEDKQEPQDPENSNSNDGNN